MNKIINVDNFQYNNMIILNEEKYELYKYMYEILKTEKKKNYVVKKKKYSHYIEKISSNKHHWNHLTGLLIRHSTDKIKIETQLRRFVKTDEIKFEKLNVKVKKVNESIISWLKQIEQITHQPFNNHLETKQHFNDVKVNINEQIIAFVGENTTKINNVDEETYFDNWAKRLLEEDIKI